MKAILVQIGIEILIQFIHQIVSAGAVGALLDRVGAYIEETESKVDDALVIPFLKAMRSVLSQRKEEIADIITEVVKK